MGNRTVAAVSDYLQGDNVGPFKKPSSGDVLVNESGIAVSNSVYTFSTKTSDYPITALDYCILVNATSNNIAITLLTAIGNSGRVFVIKRIDNSETKSVTVWGTICWEEEK